MMDIVKELVPVVTLSSLFVIISIYLLDKRSSRSSMIKAIKEELDYLNEWFGNSYQGTSYYYNWYNPCGMVYKTDRPSAIRSIVSSDKLYLLKDLGIIKDMVRLNQKIGSFNQSVDNYMMFVNSNYEIKTKIIGELEQCRNNRETEDLYHRYHNSILGKTSTKKDFSQEELFLLEVYRLNKSIHMDGIGSYNNDVRLNNRTLHTFFKDVKTRIDNEPCLIKIKWDLIYFVFPWVMLLFSAILILIVLINS